MAKCKLMIGGKTYAELTWKNGAVTFAESERARRDGFAASAYMNKLMTYDPRTGDFVSINPLGDVYDMALWCSQWVQERLSEDINADLVVEEIDFSEVLPPSESGVVY